MIVNLVNHLDRSRFEPLLALGSKEGAYLKDVAEDVPVYSLGASRSRAALPGILRAVWKLRPHAVLSTLGLNFAVAMARPFFPPGTRVLLRSGSTSTAFLNSIADGYHKRSRLQTASYRLIQRPLYGLVDQVICQSDFMLNDLVNNFDLPRQKLIRIYNPVDLEKIDCLSKQDYLPYAGAGPHLLTVGYLYRVKGYDLLLKAFREVRAAYPHATLTFIGEGVDRESLENLARELGLTDAVRFLGFQANPYPYLKHADLFVSSSRYEGFSNVILEALASGTPVVATDCPSGNREIITEGVNGWLAEPENIESLAATIQKALGELPSLNRGLIRAHCESSFSIRRITTLYEELF